jgi:hypothetical protein
LDSAADYPVTQSQLETLSGITTTYLLVMLSHWQFGINKGYISPTKVLEHPLLSLCQ